MQFHAYAIEKVYQDDGEEALHTIADQLEEGPSSSEYSGIEAPSASRNGLRLALQQKFNQIALEEGMTPRVIAKLTSTHFIDADQHCQQELLLLAEEEDACVFDDIEQFFSPDLIANGTIAALKQDPTMAVDVLGPRIASRTAVPELPVGKCLRHTSRTTCSLRCAKRHIAGPSCRPCSARGERLKTLDPEVIFLLCWIALRLALQEADITIENVIRSYIDLFFRFLAPHYFIQVVPCLEPCSIGWCVGRPRQFLRLRHRIKIISEISPLSEFSKRFYRAVAWHWSQFWLLHNSQDSQTIAGELQSELDWAPLALLYV